MRHWVPLLALGLTGAVVSGQSPVSQPTIRTGVDIVHVDVSVLDDDRRPVKGLRAADFTILEDGKPREIVAFTPVDLPPESPAKPGDWTHDVSPDVVANDFPREGRMVVMLFDQSMRLEDQPIARRAAAAAIEQLATNDLAAVVYTVGGAPQNFTGNRERLLEAVNGWFIGLADLPGRPAEFDPFPSSGAERGQCQCGTCTHETIERIADALRDAPRRKILLFFGSNLMMVTSDSRCSAIVKQAREDMFRAVDVANLTVYPMDPIGLQTLQPTASTIGTPARDRTPLIGAHQRRQSDLQVLADRTGGRAVLNANQIERQVPSIFDESRSYYALGFSPQNRGQDGRFHEIAVRVNRRKVAVQARHGYYEPGKTSALPLSAKDVPASLVETLAANWPQADLPLTIGASPFAVADSARPIVAIVVGAQRVASSGAADAAATSPSAAIDNKPVDILVGAFDQNGRSINYQFQQLEITRTAAGAGTLQYEVLSRLALEPGRYELRVAVRDGTSGRTGSMYSYVDVPNFARVPLSASGLVLEALPAVLTAPDRAFSDLLPIVPTARRAFERSDEVRAFMRIYQAGQDAPRPITVAARIQQANGQVAIEDTITLPADRFERTRAADCLMTLPLDRLTTGEHLLTLEVKDEKTPIRRQVRFDVR